MGDNNHVQPDHRAPVDPSTLVSVVIPCFNYARYLGEAIESALHQTHRPVEAIVVDDGSTDDTRRVATGYGDLVSYLYQDNSGLPAARNAGIRMAKGDFIVCLDADDTLAPEYVERCLRVLAEHPEVGFVYSQVNTFGRESNVTTYPDYDAKQLKKMNFIHQSPLIRADVLRSHPYDEKFTKGVEDWNLYLTLAEDGITGLLLDEPLLNYRKHEDMTSMLDSMAHRGRRSHLLVVRAHPRLYTPSERLSATLQAVVEPWRVKAGGLKRRLKRLGRS